MLANHLVLDKTSSSILTTTKLYVEIKGVTIPSRTTSYTSLFYILNSVNFQCACAMNHLRDGDGSRSRAREGLDSNDLVVEVLVGETVLGPGVEVVGSGDGTGRTLVLTDRPVLGEGGGTSDRGLVGAGISAESVDGTVRGDRAELGHAARARVEGTVVLNNVVLGLRVVDPAVDSEVGAAVTGRVGTGVLDGPAKC
jgi:hypothetical protein